MNLGAWLATAARDRRGDPAVFLGERPWASYGELGLKVARLAGGFRARGLAPGDRVAIVLRNIPEYLVALYAVWWAGLAAVPVNAKLHPREAGYITGHSGARLVLAEAGAVDGADTVEPGSAEWRGLAGAEPIALVPRAAGDLAWLFYTSGTTGRPKGAMLSHGNLRAMTEAYFASVDEVPAHGRLVHAAPLSHGSGLYTFTHLARGAAQVIPESAGFDAAEVLALLETHEEASMFAAPTMVKRLTEAGGGATASGLRTLVYGGGPMYLADIRAAMARFGNRFAQIYGQGESPMTITALSRPEHAGADDRRLASVGRPHRGIEVAIRDEAGADLPAHEVGEVCVRGATVMSGYWEDPAATDRALRGGWLWTGDLGALGADGYLTLKDRSKDLIISGGSNIYPREVEEALRLHPSVADAAVIGRPDPEWGEAVVAFVVARDAGATVEALDRHCLGHIARFKRPREYRFVEALPRNHYGKVLKTELRAALG